MRIRAGVSFLAMLALVAAATLLAQGRRSRITGTVVDRAGKPVAGAVVRAENPDNMPPLLEKTTDEEGKYAFGGLMGGSWKISVKADSFIPHEQMVQVSHDQRLRTEIVLDRATG